MVGKNAASAEGLQTPTAAFVPLSAAHTVPSQLTDDATALHKQLLDGSPTGGLIRIATIGITFYIELFVRVVIRHKGAYRDETLPSARDARYRDMIVY